MLGERGDAAAETKAEGLSKGWFSQIQDILHDIIAKRILNQGKGVRGNLCNKMSLLLTRSVIDAALKNTAAVAVCTHDDAVSTDSIEDELCFLRGEVVQALLNDVVAVQVLDKGHNLVAKGVNDHVDLVASGDELNHLLEGTCAVLVQSDLDHVARSVEDQFSALIVGGELQKLLTKIVAEGILHQLDHVALGLFEDQLSLLRLILLKLLLQESTAMLVLAVLVDLATHLVEVEVRITSVVCKMN